MFPSAACCEDCNYRNSQPGNAMRTIQAGPLLHRMLIAAAFAAAFAANPAQASVADHREFEATLHAPFQADPGARSARTFTLTFDYPFARKSRGVGWRLDLLAQSGQVLKRWHGVTQLGSHAKDIRLKWNDSDTGRAIPDGAYRVRMQAKDTNGRWSTIQTTKSFCVR